MQWTQISITNNAAAYTIQQHISEWVKIWLYVLIISTHKETSRLTNGVVSDKGFVHNFCSWSKYLHPNKISNNVTNLVHSSVHCSLERRTRLQQTGYLELMASEWLMSLTGYLLACILHCSIMLTLLFSAWNQISMYLENLFHMTEISIFWFSS